MLEAVCLDLLPAGSVRPALSGSDRNSAFDSIVGRAGQAGGVGGVGGGKLVSSPAETLPTVLSVLHRKRKRPIEGKFPVCLWGKKTSGSTNSATSCSTAEVK